MKKALYFIFMLSTCFAINTEAQDIPEELLGEWVFQYEVDACGNLIASGCDMQGLDISQYNSNTDFDTLLITEFKAPNESFSARYQITVIQNEPERYQFTNIDSTVMISPLEFLAIYQSDSLTFNWTTTDPGIPKFFELVSPDSLIFHWSANCLGCNCAGEIHFSRSQTSNSTTINSSSDEWKIYPNPANDFISLEKDGIQNDTKTSISLIDSKGFILKEFVTTELNHNFSIDHLQSGLFCLKFEDKNGIILKKLVIID